MANYDVNLSVKVRAGQLDAFNKKLDQTTKRVELANTKLRNAADIIGLRLPPSLNNLNAVLNKATSNFQEATRGTISYGRALFDLVKVEEILKKEQFKSVVDLNRARKKLNKEQRNERARELKEQRRLARIEKERLALRGRIAPNLMSLGGVAGGIQEQFQQGGMFAATRAQRARGAVSNALIGGGFPLLFGQGALGAAGGGIGGAVGGALGGPFGFGLSIAGTAIATRVQESLDFEKAVQKLNKAIIATGGSSTFTSSQIREFAKSLNMTKEEALDAVKSFEQFGASTRIALTKAFGDEGTFNMLASLKDNASILQNMEELSKKLSFEQTKVVLEVLKTQGARAAEEKIIDLVFEKQRKLTTEVKEQVGAVGRLRKIRKEQQAERDADFEKAKLQGQLILDLTKERTEELRRQSIISAPDDELKKLLDPLFQIDALGKSIGSSFSESFKGIVKGSMSAQDALRNLFSRTADHFLDMAAQMLAAQIRSGIFGLFSNLFGGFSITGGASLTTATGTNIGKAGFMPSNPAFRGAMAEGGPVKGGSSYLVGERGPELFSPGVSGMITPNHALGGSTNIVVNVDASGSNVEGDEDEGRALGIALSAAIETELIKQKRPGGLLA